MSVIQGKCANLKCVKLSIQICLGCQAAKVNLGKAPMCRTCQNTANMHKKKRRGAGISSHPGGTDSWK